MDWTEPSGVVIVADAEPRSVNKGRRSSGLLPSVTSEVRGFTNAMCGVERCSDNSFFSGPKSRRGFQLVMSH